MELSKIDWTLVLEIGIVAIITAGWFGYLIWQMGKNPDNHGK